MKKIFGILFLSCSLISCEKEDIYISNIPDIPDAPTPSFDTVTNSTANFKGVNWADPRDNYADDWLVLSGISVKDDSTTILEKADKILSYFKAHGANTVRLPINPATVLQNWWPKYSSVIGVATSKKMKVILAYWEGASSKDGKIDNEELWHLMWDKVVAKYVHNQNIYFELFNEPHGYTLAPVLCNIYHNWLTRHPAVPRRRVVLDGKGYATDVNSIGDDGRLNGCLLALHVYTFLQKDNTTTVDWERPLAGVNYPTRTIVTEFGTWMAGNRDFLGRPGNDMNITYMQGVTNQMHSREMGSVYWPGLRAKDAYSMFFLDSTGGMQVRSNSGLTRLQYAWGMATVDTPYAALTSANYYKIINRNSGKAADVAGGSTANGTNIIQWDYSGNNNQLWHCTALGDGYYYIINKKSGKALDIRESSVMNGMDAIQWNYYSGNSQLWRLVDIGFGYYKIINKNSNMLLDVSESATWNGAKIIQWYYNRGNNQQWQIGQIGAQQ